MGAVSDTAAGLAASVEAVGDELSEAAVAVDEVVDAPAAMS